MRKRGNKRQEKRNFFSYNFSKKNSKGIVADYLPWLLIAIAILVILMIAIFVLRGQGVSLIDKLKNILG